MRQRRSTWNLISILPPLDTTSQLVHFLGSWCNPPLLSLSFCFIPSPLFSFILPPSLFFFLFSFLSVLAFCFLPSLLFLFSSLSFLFVFFPLFSFCFLPSLFYLASSLPFVIFLSPFFVPSLSPLYCASCFGYGLFCKLSVGGYYAPSNG